MCFTYVPSLLYGQDIAGELRCRWVVSQGSCQQPAAAPGTAAAAAAAAGSQWWLWRVADALRLPAARTAAAAAVTGGLPWLARPSAAVPATAAGWLHAKCSGAASCIGNTVKLARCCGLVKAVGGVNGSSLYHPAVCSATLRFPLLLQALLGGSLAFLPAEGSGTASPAAPRDTSAIEPAPAREALKFMFSPQGAVFR